ncbi:DUF551 domain-containing protein [Escherichia coli]|nr:DUF551 domain-containing protein [Escherichia coli]
MSTITKERIELFIKSPLGNGLTRGEQMELARIALASLEAEPVGAFHIAEQQVDGTSDYIKDGEWPIDNGTIEVYAAPPVPVVPAALPENDDEDGQDIDYLEPSEVYALGRTAGWNACRAAMLQAKPVSNSDELPLDYLQGHKDGLEWAAQLAEANHPQTGDWLYDDPIDLARAIRKGPDMPTVQAGNYPVTPDGWISCSERMPDKLIPVMVMYEDGEMWSAMWNGNRWDDGTEYPDPHSVTHWREMPAAPKQEVKS